MRIIKASVVPKESSVHSLYPCPLQIPYFYLNNVKALIDLLFIIGIPLIPHHATS